MAARMKPPVYCENCGTDSRYVTHDQEVLEDYGVCLACMMYLYRYQMGRIEAAYDNLNNLASQYPPLEELVGGIGEHLEKVVHSS